MRDLAPTGGAAAQVATLNLTTVGQAANGTVREVYVPEGYKCILTVGGRGIPSANTVAVGPWVDNQVTNPQSSQTVDMWFSGSVEITKPGLHTIGVAAYASSAAGTFINGSISWIIVRR